MTGRTILSGRPEDTPDLQVFLLLEDRIYTP